MPNGTPISCDFKGGCTYSIDGSGARMTGQADPSRSSSSSGTPWSTIGYIAGGITVATAVILAIKTYSEPVANRTSHPSPAPMPATIEKGGRRHSRRKHHSKNKTRRA